MSKNTTKKKLDTGFVDLWPTTVLVDRFDVSDRMIELAMVLKADPTLEELVLNLAVRYIEEVVGVSASAYSILAEPDVRRTLQNSTVSVPGEMPFHQHARTHLTAICYIQTTPGEGKLLLHDPRHNAARGYDHRFQHLFNPVELEPTPGDVILFPSFLYHSVTPANNLRLVVPFDVFLNK